MRLHEAKKIIAGKQDSEDVSERFGAIKGSVSAGQLRKLMEGHHDEESVLGERLLSGNDRSAGRVYLLWLSPDHDQFQKT